MGRRIIHMRGINGKTVHFLIDRDTNNSQRFQSHSGERVQKLMRLIGRWMLKNHQTRKRNIHLHVPVTIPISTHTNLVQIPSLDHFSMSLPYRQTCVQVGQKDVYSPQDYYRRSGDKKKEAYGEIVGSIPDGMLLEHISNLTHNSANLFAYRRQVTLQLAALSALSYVLGIKVKSTD